MSRTQDEYQRLVDEMTPAQRIERAANLLAWARDLTGRQIVAIQGEMSAERLKWEVALQHYGHQPVMRRLIEKVLAKVPR